MNQELRGGNSRLLAKGLDQLDKPLAVLDRRGTIVYVNSALCGLAGADATRLVGQACSWQIADDDMPFAPLLTALAPPASALKGKVVIRQLSVPIVFGSTATGQLFVPLLDDDSVLNLMLVVLGPWEQLKQQEAELSSISGARRRSDQTLVKVRSQWKTLDGLLALVGESPAIELAMVRAQLAIASDCSLLVVGGKQVGKQSVLRAIFLGRLKRVGVPRHSGQFLPLDCALMDAELFGGMLDVFTGRLRAGAARVSQLLMLQHVDQLSEVAVQQLLAWLQSNELSRFTICASSWTSSRELATRGAGWRKLLALVSQLEIEIPSLARRAEDAPALAQHIMSDCCRRLDRAQLTFAPDTTDLVAAYPWPGNLRQLTAAIEESVQHAVLSSAIQPQHLPVAVRTFPSTADPAQAPEADAVDLDAVLLELEKIMLQRALKLSPRNRARAARLLGISRPRLLRRVKQLGLDAGDSADD